MPDDKQHNLQNTSKVNDNLLKLAQSKCHIHSKLNAEYFCTHSDCIENSKSFICELCMQSHNVNHASLKFIKSSQSLFSKRILENAKDIGQELHNQIEQNSDFQTVSTKIDKSIDELESKLVYLIKKHCQQIKENLKTRIDNRRALLDKNLEMIIEYESMLNRLLSKDDIPAFKSLISEYIDKNTKLTKIFQSICNLNDHKAISNRGRDVHNITRNIESNCKIYYKTLDYLFNDQFALLQQDILLPPEKNQKDIERMQIFVITPSEGILTIETESYVSIENLKIKIHKKEGIPVEQQKLFFAGKELNNKSNIVDYAIQNGSTLDLKIKYVIDVNDS